MSAGVFPIALPVKQGGERGFHADLITDANNEHIATVAGIPQHTSVADLGKMVDSNAFSGTFNEGAARAEYVVLALNAMPVMLQALLQAQEALKHAMPTHAHYPEPVERHERAKRAVEAALAVAGQAEQGDKRWGWSADDEGKLYTSLGVFKVVPEQKAQVGGSKVARYITDAVNAIHRLGGAGL